MASLTICDSVLKVKDQVGNNVVGAELVMESRKSQVHSADAIYVSRPSRNTAQLGSVIQDLTYIVTPSSTLLTTLVTVTYTSGGTAGSEIVTVINTDISVQIENSVSTALQIQTAVQASVAASALVFCILSGTSSTAQVVVSATSMTDSYCYLALAETSTDSQQVVFTLNYYEEGSYYGSIIFDPVYVPDQSYVDLSTMLTVSRG